jgi:hypothetical protein
MLIPARPWNKRSVANLIVGHFGAVSASKPVLGALAPKYVKMKVDSDKLLKTKGK